MLFGFNDDGVGGFSLGVDRGWVDFTWGLSCRLGRFYLGVLIPDGLFCCFGLKIEVFC